MQTFLPYQNFTQSARVLDWRRLGKQRVETKQIIMALESTRRTGWRNHPAVKMWRGHEGALARYGAAMCIEWKRRGYRDTLTDFFLERLDFMFDDYVPEFVTPEFTLSHQSNLVRKDPDYYRPHFPHVPDDLPYVWPKV